MGAPKQLFDWIKVKLGRGLTQAEVDAINAAAGANVKPDPPTAPEAPSSPRLVGPQGEALIKRFEGCARLRKDGMVEAYPDPGTGGAPWTIGWGATGKEITKGTVWTKEQCEHRFALDMERYSSEVRRALGPAIDATSQAQFDALVAFHYNTGAIANATLTRKHIAGDFEAAANEFGKWVYADGRILKGLVLRRAEEAKLYRSGL